MKSPWFVAPLSILLLFHASTLRAQTADADLTQLAQQLIYGNSQKLQEKTKVRGKGPYLVTDFETAPSDYDRLGVVLADDFEQALQETSPEFATLGRTKVGELLEKERLGPKVLRCEEVALWFAGLRGARSVIFGKISPIDGGFEVRVRLVNPDGEELSQATTLIEYSPERRALLRVPPPDTSSLLSPHYTPRLDGSGRTGLALPKCVYCPQPPYSGKARSAHFQGTILLEVLIGTDGGVHVISLGHPLPFGLTVITVDVVRRWKFARPSGPGTKAEGRVVTIKVSFRLSS